MTTHANRHKEPFHCTETTMRFSVMKMRFHSLSHMKTHEKDEELNYKSGCK